ncbi:MAG: xanthine dehydrogenase [Acidobacteria bacterium]|nr:MAG: xanthine dehydrogenase [Acidobacteriota bacterium]
MRSEIYRELRQALADERLVILATVVGGPGAGGQLLLYPDGTRRGDLGIPELEAAVTTAAEEAFARQAPARIAVDAGGRTADLFLDVMAPRRTLIAVGAVHVAIPLVSFANTLGFRTVVVDPRTAFATRERFPHAAELRTDWPDEALRQVGLNEGSYVAVLSHDLKLDLPALEVALASPARYVGALGSKKTHRKRLAALREAGFDERRLARIHNPIGLPLGGRRAEEIALAIVAEMVAVSHGRAQAARAVLAAGDAHLAAAPEARQEG